MSKRTIALLVHFDDDEETDPRAALLSVHGALSGTGIIKELTVSDLHLTRR
jgi:hypothetical protein